MLNIQNKVIVEIEISCQYPRAFVQISSLILLFSVAVFHFLSYFFNRKSEQNKQNSVSHQSLWSNYWGWNMVLNALGNCEVAKSQVLRKKTFYLMDNGDT